MIAAACWAVAFAGWLQAVAPGGGPDGGVPPAPAVAPAPTEAPRAPGQPGMGGQMPLMVENLHVVISRQGDRVEVSEMWRLVGGSAADSRALRFALPPGALAPLPAGPKGAPPLIERDGDGFRLTRGIPRSGLEVGLRFELPISNGVAVIRQQLPARVAATEIVSRWTAGDATLLVEGVGPGERAQLTNGLLALVVQAERLDGQLVIKLAGLEDLDSPLLPRATLIVCVLMLLGGLGLWIRRR